MNRSSSRTIELDEKDALPRSKHEPPVLDGDENTITGEDRTQVCVCIPVIVRIGVLLGDEPIEECVKIITDRTIRILVDDDTARGVER